MAKREGTKVTTNKVRFSYVHVFEPYAHEADQPKKYSVSLLIPKDDKEGVDAIKAAIQEAAEQGKGKWGGKIPKGLKLPLRDGDEEREDSEEYKGCYFINASSNRKPGVVNKQLQQITDEDEEFYSGCYGRANINFYAFAVSGNKGVACGLNHVQKLEDGESLGGSGGSAAAAFDDEESDSLFDDDLPL